MLRSTPRLLGRVTATIRQLLSTSAIAISRGEMWKRQRYAIIQDNLFVWKVLKKYFSIYIVDFYPSAAPCAFADDDEDFVLGVVHGGAGQ